MSGIVERLGARARLGDPGRPTALARRFAWLVRPLVAAFFGPRLEGFERLPRDRACLLVANHSGSGASDVVCFVHAVLGQPGEPPRLTGMAHPAAFFVPLVALYLRAFGAIPSTYAAAERALGSGCSVLVFPGGDHEAFRPIWQAKRVDWNGRQGFLRLARRAWVPIIPVGIRGTHYTLPILWRSRVLPWLGILPRAFGIKRLPVTITWLAGAAAILALLAPTHGALVAVAALAAWTACPLAFFIPVLPWRVRISFGERIEPGTLFGTRESTAPLDASYEVVRERVEALVRQG
ncbi:MAG TPA: 1-acyl-sn-glycerol-3-phosphate acyltransferase [Planctomycetota bacterium]|nr:1-acyl-sn-glycerol-3-phosphate acyltransferase [Planctomycetota bacterium]